MVNKLVANNSMKLLVDLRLKYADIGFLLFVKVGFLDLNFGVDRRKYLYWIYLRGDRCLCRIFRFTST